MAIGCDRLFNLYNAFKNNVIAVNVIITNPARQRISHIIGRQERRSVIAPHMADTGKARNMQKTKIAKYFKSVSLNILFLLSYFKVGIMDKI